MAVSTHAIVRGRIFRARHLRGAREWRFRRVLSVDGDETTSRKVVRWIEVDAGGGFIGDEMLTRAVSFAIWADEEHQVPPAEPRRGRKPKKNAPFLVPKARK